jgi:hypothetical protein
MKFKEFFLNEKWEIVANIKNFPIRVNLADIDMISTNHGQEREARKDNQGSNVTKEEIKLALEMALGKVFSDYANGEIENNSEFLVRRKLTDLNIIATITMRKGPDNIRVITVMRKKGFTPKTGTYVYDI